MASYLSLMSITLVDSNGTRTTHDVFINVPDTVTVAQLATMVGSYNALLANLSGSKEIDAQVKLHLPISGGRSNAASGSKNESTGLFAYSQANSTYKMAIDVPAILDTLIVNGKIDLTATAITDWDTFLTTAHTGVTVVSKFNNAIGTRQTAATTFRKHRRSLNRTSTETG